MRDWAPKSPDMRKILPLDFRGKRFRILRLFDAPKHIFDMRDWAPKSRKMRKILPLNACTRAGYDILYFLERRH